MIILVLGTGIAFALCWTVLPTLFGCGVAALYRTLEKRKCPRSK